LEKEDVGKVSVTQRGGRLYKGSTVLEPAKGKLAVICDIKNWIKNKFCLIIN
jgi:hypothetical protein